MNREMPFLPAERLEQETFAGSLQAKADTEKRLLAEAPLSGTAEKLSRGFELATRLLLVEILEVPDLESSESQ